jgi:thiol:disulfide interchange protein DsbA
MLKIKFTFLTLILILFTSPNVLAQKYVQISTERQQESKDIIIYEFFWYGCPHCYNLEPTMDRIEANLDKDTRVVKLPVALRESWLPHAKLYYALKQMNKINEMHNLIFEEIHIEDNRLISEQQIMDFLGRHGIYTDKFKEKYNSFGTEARIKKASNLAKKYQIDSVPTIIVNGKYLTSGSYVSSYDELYSVVNLLIERERNDL